MMWQKNRFTAADYLPNQKKQDKKFAKPTYPDPVDKKYILYGLTFPQQPVQTIVPKSYHQKLYLSRKNEGMKETTQSATQTKCTCINFYDVNYVFMLGKTKAKKPKTEDYSKPVYSNIVIRREKKPVHFSRRGPSKRRSRSPDRFIPLRHVPATVNLCSQPPKMCCKCRLHPLPTPSPSRSRIRLPKRSRKQCNINEFMKCQYEACRSASLRYRMRTSTSPLCKMRKTVSTPHSADITVSPHPKKHIYNNKLLSCQCYNQTNRSICSQSKTYMSGCPRCQIFDSISTPHSTSQFESHRRKTYKSESHNHKIYKSVSPLQSYTSMYSTNYRPPRFCRIPNHLGH